MNRPSPLQLSPALLVACPDCDLLHLRTDVADGMRARCQRCGAVLFAPRARALSEVVALSLAAAILMSGAIFFPFLQVSVGGLSHASSIFDTAVAFSRGLLLPLSVAVLLLIVLLPLLRVLLLLYTLVPLARGRPPLAHARNAFRLASLVRPWAMAEVFVVGTGVALVKIAGLASVGLGPAFWAFAALSIVVVLKDSLMCEWTIWSAIGPPGTA